MYNARISSVLGQVDSLQKRLRDQQRLNSDARATTLLRKVASMTESLESVKAAKLALEQQVQNKQVRCLCTVKPLQISNTHKLYIYVCVKLVLELVIVPIFWKYNVRRTLFVYHLCSRSNMDKTITTLFECVLVS